MTSPKFRTCSPPQAPAPFVLVLGKVTFSHETPGLALPAPGELHFLPAKTLAIERLATECFHPPEASA